MTESPFAITSRIINEPSNLFDLLRIIAGEAKLNEPDRQYVRMAADELEMAQRNMVMVCTELAETRQRLIAVSDQLLAARKAVLPRAKWSLSSGWIRMDVAP